MNIRIDSQESRLNGHFFRTADRMRVEGCVSALAHEGLSLALSCMHEALLDHYLQILLQRLRETAPDLGIEVYFPTNTEALIARFNEALASQSLREATRSNQEACPPQIWLVHDAQQLPEQELQLLARLIQNFPGANIRAVLLMVGPPPTQEALSAFGRKLLRWDIEGPTDEQIETALEVARHHGQADAVTLLLRRMGKRRSTLQEVPPAPVVVASQAVAEPTQPSARRAWKLPRWQMPPWRMPQGLPLTNAWPPKLSLDALRQRGPLLGAAAGALALSVLLMMWIQPASFGLKGKGRGSADAPVSSAQANPQAAQTTVTSVSAAPAASVPIEVPDAAAEAQVWVRGLPPSSYLIQHATTATYDKAQQILQSSGTLREARIVAAFRPGENLAHFVLVSGVYESAGKAYERLNKRDFPANSWVRATSSLQQQLAVNATPQEKR